MLISLFGATGIVHKEFVPPGQTVNQQFCSKVFKILRVGVRKKRPEMWSGGDWFRHHDNAPAHMALCVQQFMAKTCRLSLILPIHLTCAVRLFHVPSYERPDERETFCWCQGSEKENAGGLEQHQHGRVPEMFSAVGKNVGTSVLGLKESTLKETRVVIV